MPASLFDAVVDDRLEEVAATLQASLPQGFPSEHDRRFFTLRRDQLLREKDAELERWLVYALVARERHELVGHAGFHGRRGVNCRGDGRAVELGYHVFAPFRGQGYASEAVAALIDWASQRGVRRFLLSIAPDNEPSLRLARRLGFHEIGEHWDDEDGQELELELVR